jgi:hypothetical protein
MLQVITTCFIAIIGFIAMPVSVDHFVPALMQSQPGFDLYGVLAVGLDIGTGLYLAVRCGVNRAFGVQ